MEDLLAIGGPDARAVILDSQLQRSVRDLRGEANVTVSRCVLESVVEQVGKYALYSRRVDLDHWQVGRHRNLDRAPVQQSTNPIESASYKGGRRRSHRVRVSRVSVVRAGRLYEVVEELGQAVRLALDL